MTTRDPHPVSEQEHPMALLQRDPKTFLFFAVVIAATFLI